MGTDTQAVARLSSDYEQALAACLSGDEASINSAYQLGRDALRLGLGLLDLINLHFEALARVVAETREESRQLVWPAQRTFLLETLAPFEMVHRGFTEANQALREANVDLDRRVKKRTAELEAAAEALREAVDRERAGREALERSETRAARLFESSLIGILEEDEDHVFEANDAFLRLIGHTRKDLVDGKISRRHLTAPEFLGAEDDAIEQLKAFGETPPYEKEYVTKDGTRVPVLIGRALLEREPFRQVCFVLDMTEQKHAQTEVERVRNEFLGVISHELKTPLTVIKGSTSMALSVRFLPDRAQTEELFQVIDDQVERLRELVSNLLDITRIEAGTLSVSPVEEDVGEVIEEATAIFRRTGASHRVEVEIARHLPSVLADRRRVVQVVLNLLTNASKHSPPTAPIKLVARADAAGLLVQVTDTGAGIPTDKLHLLFQKFTQLHPGSGRGTGLGLAISKGIVEAHGGRIWAESGGEGKGATFSFTLPLTVGAAAVARVERAKPASRAKTRKTRVLVVDDSPEVLRLVHHCLAEEGYEPVLTGEGLKVKGLVKTKKPGLVLLDLRLAGISGIDVLKQIRLFSDVPVIFMTADDHNTAIEQAMREIPSVDSLGKPFSPEELMRTVTRALNAGAARP